jgi:hypothetical protein
VPGIGKQQLVINFAEHERGGAAVHVTGLETAQEPEAGRAEPGVADDRVQEDVGIDEDRLPGRQIIEDPSQVSISISSSAVASSSGIAPYMRSASDRFTSTTTSSPSRGGSSSSGFSTPSSYRASTTIAIALRL